MNIAELQDLVKMGESTALELKQSTGQRTDAAKTVCAMLNGAGGFVIFGVTDKGVIVGQEIGASTVEDVLREVRRIEPPAVPDLETIRLNDNRAVLVLRVTGSGGPYIYDGRAFMRSGASTVVMPRDLLQRQFLEKGHGSARWENQPTPHLRIDDLDRDEIVRTIEESIRRQRLEDPGTRDPHTLLTGLGLIREGVLLNAAVVLFGKKEVFLQHYPQCVLRMARFRGRVKDEFIDNRQEQGNAFDLWLRGQRFLMDHLPVAGRIVPNIFERVDDPMFPPAALREALANAICHRDYSIVGGAVTIAIYDDRVEISSSGRLHFDLTTDELKRPHPSRPWNPLIAQTFYRRGLIEIWGRGTLKMVELAEAAGLPSPEFECVANEFTVRFRSRSRIGGASQSVSHASDLREAILSLLHAETDPLAISEILVRLGEKHSRRTVQDKLAKLRSEKIVTTSGTGRWTKWRIRKR
jgi:ATP-dependent DNA helicase RecG